MGRNERFGFVAEILFIWNGFYFIFVCWYKKFFISKIELIRLLKNVFQLFQKIFVTKSTKWFFLVEDQLDDLKLKIRDQVRLNGRLNIRWQAFNALAFKVKPIFEKSLANRGRFIIQIV